MAYIRAYKGLKKLGKKVLAYEKKLEKTIFVGKVGLGLYESYLSFILLLKNGALNKVKDISCFLYDIFFVVKQFEVQFFS